ncbi:MAG: thiamine pyrophosphate-binding protein [Leptospiraceae bacterium]|nr:thiamine pyrophosphate-binding protein [Leptospiraceae bacterium]MCB1314468.1 thiamine pyrophosphate-binding protein [Leptospiraceae bacterium]
MHGGELVARVLKKHGVPYLFTLCGGHISPILTACKRNKIRVIDVRHEVNAVFAADAVSRLTGIPGVAAVTAGPGLTNTITAVKNAELAQSPLVLLGGATATILRGRGSLQDIDQMKLMRPHVKRAIRVKRVRDIVPALTSAFEKAVSGVPGPVFVELPIDLLYEESLVREWYLGKNPGGGNWRTRLMNAYLGRHLNRIFRRAELFHDPAAIPEPMMPRIPQFESTHVEKVAAALAESQRPLLLIGSQAMLNPTRVSELRQAVEKLGIPVYLAGMARGLLGQDHALQMRHKRRDALREADLVILAGLPCDFRLDYGRHIKAHTQHIAINRSSEDLTRNKRPHIKVAGDPGAFLISLSAAQSAPPDRSAWSQKLRDLNTLREQEIAATARQKTKFSNPVRACQEIEAALDKGSVLVADGGDFVGTAAYIVQPRQPLSWLDPGLFGTLGVGAGFALGAKLVNPKADIWILYGDGSCAYSLAEFDTFARHNLPVIAVVGNDGAWSQIAREQVEILKDDVGTVLNLTDYHKVAEGYGGKGLLVKSERELNTALKQARKTARSGKAVLVNILIGKTDFRKGSLSM